ncbi:MAG TPA: leucine-rich repeat domain-containing protein [Bacteroidales bacterium]|nr:leucine-rich repeat domain-containing protein [Bacteroidales bacterium]
MRNTRLLLVMLFALSLFNNYIAAQEVAISLNVQTAGTLRSMINVNKLYLITDLTISGNLNGSDINCIREMAGRDGLGAITTGKLSKLDMSNANICSGEVYYRSSNYYPYLCSKDTIGANFFKDCKALSTIILPNNILIIDGGAFSGCTGLTSITIPTSVLKISYYAFSGCTSLNSFTIPKNVVKIEGSAFLNCKKINSFKTEEGNQYYKTIDGVLFDKEGVNIIAYPNAKSEIYTIPNGVKTIDPNAFQGSNIYSITLPYGVKIIPQSSFSGCQSLSYITIPNSVTTIEREAFYQTNLPNVVLPESVTSIGVQAFYQSNLRSITIPKNVTNIGYGAFSSCYKLIEIHCNIQTPLKCDASVFKDVIKTTCKLYVPKGTYSAYWLSDMWGDFTNIIEEVENSNNTINVKKEIIFTDQDVIVVKGQNSGKTIRIYSIMGQLIFSSISTDYESRIKVKTGQNYIVKIADRVYKVAL